MNDEDKKTPHSTEAEQSVLGALMLENGAFDRVGALEEKHFYVADHRVFFAEMRKQYNSGKDFDLITICETLRRMDSPTLAYLNDVQQNTPSSANIARYAGIVVEKAQRRELIKLGRLMEDNAINSPDELENQFGRAVEGIEAIFKTRDIREPKRVSETLVAHLEALQARTESSSAISTGFPDMDDHLAGGVRPGNFIIIAARPKMGKSAFAGHMALNIAATHPALFLSGEMPEEQLHDRNIANIGKIPLGELLQPNKMANDNWNRLTGAVEKLTRLDLYLDYQGGYTLMDVRRKAKDGVRKYGLKVLFIDYLQLMEGEGNNRNAQIEGITRGLKALAMDLKITIIALSQLNRKLEERGDKRPIPADLRDSGAIEQDADAVIFLYRDDVYVKDSLNPGLCEANIALCRHGQAGVVNLFFRGEFMRFESAPMGWEPQKEQYTTKKKSSIADNL